MIITMIHKNKNTIKSIICKTALKSLKNSLIKSNLINEIFQKKYILDRNKQIYIPDELVFIIKTYVFYDLNNKNDSLKYYFELYKTVKNNNKN
jgi:hypothetical protein